MATTQLLHQFELTLQFVDTMSESRVMPHIVNDRLLSMNDGGVISASEMQSYRIERACRQFFTEIHRNLPCLNDFLFAGFVAKQLLFNAEKFCCVFLDRLNR